MYGKLKNGALYIAPTPLKTDGWDVFTNDPRVYLANGYKPVEFSDYPSDGQIYAADWIQTDDTIIQHWNEVPQNDDLISDFEALEIITGGADI